MILMGIDPSINNCGVCIFSKINIEPPASTIYAPIISFHHTALHEAKNLAGRLVYLQSFLKNIIDRDAIDAVIIEQPERQSSIKSQAGFEKGDFVKLCAAFGVCVAVVAPHLPNHNIILVTPSKWKGQVPKRITRQRLYDKYVTHQFLINQATDDEVDALGLIDWYITKNEC